LIRWSDDGSSFIVLDEDEFAKTLIPELFKHNNYASFVRQLNMYGFHKKVGLSDNSMKASENKRKTPSEYFNKYFRRGRPELLWLIQKPKNPPSSKRKREDGKGVGQGDSDDERKYTPIPVERPAQASVAAEASTKDVTVIPKTELTHLKQELRSLQQQQKMISAVIQQMKQQNDQFFRQATAFQEMHSRHENSINAILTFLATFYNRSLEGQGNFAEMFGNQLPQNNTQHGNIVDMSDFPEVELNMPRPGQMQRKPRQPLLLPAPDAKKDAASPRSPATVRAPTASPKIKNSSIFPRNTRSSTTAPANDASVTTPPIKTDAETPNLVSDNHDMMSVINAANSASPPTTGPGLDFDSALQHFQNADGNIPLTMQQRNEVLSMMQANINKGVATSNPRAPANNALNNPESPMIPSFPQMPASQEQLAYLQKLQESQAANVQSLADRLQPLSPSGQIPGLYEGNGDPPQDFNLDDWLGTAVSGEYFPDQSFNADPNFDASGLGFGFDDANAPAVGVTDNNGNAHNGFLSEEDARLLAESVSNQGRVESVSSRGTSPTSPVNLAEVGTIPKKRRKVT
jgi:heat shock transcription factor